MTKQITNVSANSSSAPYINRKYKDRLFRFIFNNKKDLLDLYNAINGTDYSNPDDLTITTLEDVVFLGMKNDVSFLIDSALNLYEHQSTYSPNMPLRGLFYFSDILRNYVEEQQLDLYSSKKLPLPLPQFIVFYNGTQGQPDRKLLYLSDCFQYPENQQRQTTELQQPEATQNQAEKNNKLTIPAALECTALMLNINYGHNRVLMEKCKRLEEYAYFISSVRDYLFSGYEPRQAIQLAADESIAQNKLADILSKNRREVVDMLLTSFDEEKYKALVKKEAYEDGWEKGWKDGREEGREEGWKEGREEGRIEGQEAGIRLTKLVLKLSAQGLTMEEIATQTKTSLEQIHKILDEEPDSVA